MAKMLLEKAGIAYRWVDAEDNVELTTSMGVKKAPTLLVPEDGEVKVFENASNIKGYIESKK
jgi:ribonucleoside-triphosphate reductase